MKRVITIVLGIIFVMALDSCTKTCVCTSRSRNTDGSIWEWETSFKATGGTSCVENAENRWQGTIEDKDGNVYPLYECREE